MAYSDAKSLREQSASIAGVAIIHAGMGALVVLGLAATIVPDIVEDNGLIAVNIDDTVAPPPPNPPTDVDKPERPITKASTKPKTTDQPINVPTSDLLPPSGPAIGDTGPINPGFGSNDFSDIELPGGGLIEPTPTPTPTFAFDPVSATPRGAPSGWITERDYRSSWIRREMTGVASFSLGVGTDGRVTNCSVTRSTGHDVLDEATCKLISKRARFNPAKDRNGDIVAGNFSSAVRWQLPE